jgi:hypothetical protein
MASDPVATLGSIIPDAVREWRSYSPDHKAAIRTQRGAFLLTFSGYGAAMSPDADVAPLLAAPLLLGLLWLFAGVNGPRGPLNIVGAVWWGLGALGCGFLLASSAYPADWGPSGAFWLRGLYLAALAGCVARCWAAARPMPRATLPDPATVPGLPNAGPASPQAAHAAIMRRRGGGRRWWQFWT